MRRTLFPAAVVVVTLLASAGVASAVPGDPGDLPPDVVKPIITLTTPSAGAEFAQGQSVTADYSCSDLHLESCTGTLADGAPIPTNVLGTFTFTVDAADEAGNPARTSHTYHGRDRTAPTASISSPGQGAVYVRGQAVNASYSCGDSNGIASCAGPVANGAPIDTATLGAKSFTVTARDTSNNATQVTHGYTVVDGTSPTATITAPVDGARVVRGQALTADFACADESGGSGLASCTGDVADGAALPTGTLGAFTFSVTAVDNAGNTKVATVDYEVLAPRCAGRAVTVMLALGDRPTTGADVILGTPARNVVDGRGGADTICGLGGNDQLTGGAGTDLLDGGPGQDHLVGGTQRDTCRGGPQRDTQTGCEVKVGLP